MLESTRNLGFGGTGLEKNLPKILAELQGLTFSLVTGAGSSTPMDVAGIEDEDTLLYAFNLTDLTEVDLGNCTILSRRATGTLTVSGVEDGDEVEVNGRTYVFTDVEETIAYNRPPGIVPITVGPSGSDDEDVAAMLATVLMSSDSHISAAADGAVVTITWRAEGTAGNSKTLVVTGSGGHVSRSGANLSGGAAAGDAAIECSDSLSGKKVLLVWYNKQ